MFGNLFQLVIKDRGQFFEQQVIAFSFLAKAMIVTDDNGMRMKFINEKMLYIVFRLLVGKRVIEVNIFDFNKEVYDQELRVYVKKYLREEIKFDSLEELVRQIDQDKVESLKVL